MKCHFYQDPGHGWLKVKKKTLKMLGIDKSITPYSYQRGEYAYLEEDCDLHTFMIAIRDNGIDLKYDEHHTNRISKIRSYDRYRVEE